MNIYFACSITGGRDFEPIYREITAYLLTAGHEVPTAHLADSRVKEFEGRVPSREVFERDTAWIRSCDSLIAEVSTPSHGVGYEISYALSLGKPVLCVYRQGQPISKMLTGNSHPNFCIRSYQDSIGVVQSIHSFLNDLNEL